MKLPLWLGILALVSNPLLTVSPVVASDEVLVDQPVITEVQRTLFISGSGSQVPASYYTELLSGLTLEQDTVSYSYLYQSVGSQAAFEAFIEKSVAFAAVDSHLSNEQIQAYVVEHGSEPLVLPVFSGGIVVQYNLPGISSLRLSRAAYIGIFSGEITRWNDPIIALDNPGVELPDVEITVFHRRNGNSVTQYFTEHLSAISPEWDDSFGAGRTIDWPTQVGNFQAAKWNEGVLAYILQTEGSIGYVDYGYATQVEGYEVRFASLENKRGNFVAPSSEPLALATIGNKEFRIDVSDPTHPQAYPLATVSWLLLHPEYEDEQVASGVEYLLQEMLKDDDSLLLEYGLLPLNSDLQKQVVERGDELTEGFQIELE